MSDAISRFAKIQPSNRPKVAEENNRSDTPLSKRSISTMTKPSTTPNAKPGHESPMKAEEIFAPIAAQNVMNSARSRLIVNAGVIIGLHLAKASPARASQLRSLPRCRDRKEYRAPEDCQPKRASR